MPEAPLPAKDALFARGMRRVTLWVPIIRSWALTRGFALHPGTTNRYEIRYAKTQHRPPSRQVNDHGRVSGTHTVALNESTQEWLLLDIADASDPCGCP